MASRIEVVYLASQSTAAELVSSKCQFSLVIFLKRHACTTATASHRGRILHPIRCSQHVSPSPTYGAATGKLCEHSSDYLVQFTTVVVLKGHPGVESVDVCAIVRAALFFSTI